MRPTGISLFNGLISIACAWLYIKASDMAILKEDLYLLELVLYRSEDGTCKCLDLT